MSLDIDIESDINVVLRKNDSARYQQALRIVVRKIA
jgi:hypothetical protein